VLQDDPTTAFIPQSSIGRQATGETGRVQGLATSGVDTASLRVRPSQVGPVAGASSVDVAGGADDSGNNRVTVWSLDP
jgi:hypothetical protein